MSGITLAFWSLGPVELVVILLVALLVFGRRLPEVARSLGQGLVEFRKGLRDDPGDAPQALPEPTADSESSTEEGAYPEVVEDAAPETGDEPEDDDEAEKSPAG